MKLLYYYWTTLIYRLQMFWSEITIHFRTLY